MKKIIKTIGAITGLGAIASGATMVLTSCNDDSLTMDFEQTPVESVSIADINVNKANTIILNVSVTNKSKDQRIPATEVHETVTSPTGVVDASVKITVKEDFTVDYSSIKFLIKSPFVTADIGTWSIMISAKHLKPWTFSFKVIA